MLAYGRCKLISPRRGGGYKGISNGAPLARARCSLLLLRLQSMAWTSCVVAKTNIVCATLYALLLLSLDAVGFRGVPCIARQGPLSSCRRHTLVRMAAARRGEAQEDFHRFNPEKACTRKDMLRSVGLIGSAILCGRAMAERTEAADRRQDEPPTVGKITKNGVKYFDYRVGGGANPRWGQDCIVRFTMYGRSAPDDKLTKIQSSDDNQDTYLFKHGNGLQIKGMEEGIHSMRVGGKRRIIMPQGLGYTVQGLGPYPADPRKRDVLVKVLTSFETTATGELVMDVELLDAFDDEADQGYYDDLAVTPEQLQELVQDTGQFSGGVPLEKFKGQLASPMDDTARSSTKKSDGGLPGQLGKDLMGS